MTPASEKQPQAISDRKPSDAPDTAELGKLVSSLTRLGIRGQDLAALITATKSRAENAEALRKWLRDRPKKK